MSISLLGLGLTCILQHCSKSRCPWVVCLCVCAIIKKTLPSGLDTYGQRGIFGYSIFPCFSTFFLFGYLQTSLLCIMGELAGWGYVAVACAVSDKWQVIFFLCFLFSPVLFRPFFFLSVSWTIDIKKNYIFHGFLPR